MTDRASKAPIPDLDSSDAPNNPPKRTLCSHCGRPKWSVCICAALPESRFRLKRCHVLVLQHPHELRRKNRSLFLAELCLTTDSLTCVRGRRILPHLHEEKNYGDVIDPLLSPTRSVWLVFPHPQAKSLDQALAERKQKEDSNSEAPLTLVFLDATWKFASEMERSSVFPSHVQYVRLDEKELNNLKPKRFDIRTPPSPVHLSTAECLALVVSHVEENPNIYEVMMKPLDLMVSQWHTFIDAKKAP